MMHHNEKLDHADVVAVFEAQDAADEAVLGTTIPRTRRCGSILRRLPGKELTYRVIAVDAADSDKSASEPATAVTLPGK